MAREVKLVAEGSRELLVEGRYVLVLPGETILVPDHLAAELVRNPEWLVTPTESPQAGLSESGGTQDTTPGAETSPGPDSAQNPGV